MRDADGRVMESRPVSRLASLPSLLGAFALAPCDEKTRDDQQGDRTREEREPVVVALARGHLSQGTLSRHAYCHDQWVIGQAAKTLVARHAVGARAGDEAAR